MDVADEEDEPVQLPAAAHDSQPWRIHAIAPEFRIEDVWALPTLGGPDDFALLLRRFAAGDPTGRGPAVVRLLFALRWGIGRLLGWDRPPADLQARSLLDRLPADLRRTTAGMGFDALPFTPLFRTRDEFAAEIINRTVHGILHLGWVPDADGGHRGQMAVLVKPNGRFGTAYLNAIRPVRHAVVYPALLRQIERSWNRRMVAA